MDNKLLTELMDEINTINKQEQDINTGYLSLQETVDALTYKKSGEIKQAERAFVNIQGYRLKAQYRKTKDINDLKGKNIVSYPTLSASDLVTTLDDSDDYLKPWGKLDKQQKINRLMDYANNLKISNDELVQLRSLLIDAVNERKVTKKTDVEYCTETGKVLKINGLKQNVKTRYFYIGKDDSEVKVIHSEATLKPMRKINLGDLTKLPKVSPPNLPPKKLNLKLKES